MKKNRQIDKLIKFAIRSDFSNYILLATSTTSGPTLPPITEGNHRTVVFVFAQTNPGQDLFIRGGIDHLIRPGCVEDAETSECAIDISVSFFFTVFQTFRISFTNKNTISSSCTIDKIFNREKPICL